MANGNGMGVSHAYNPMWFKRILAEENITEEQLLDVDCSGKILVLCVCVCVCVCISVCIFHSLSVSLCIMYIYIYIVSFE